MRKLYVRIFLSFAAVIMLSSVIIGVTGYQRSANALEKQYRELLTQIVDNVVHQTDSYLKNTERATLSILTSDLVKQAFEQKNLTVYNGVAYDELLKSQVFQPVLINNPEISMVYLIGDNGVRVRDFNMHIVPFNYQGFNDYMDRLRAELGDSGDVYIRDSGFLSGHLTMARNISNRQTSGNFIGMLGFELRAGELNKLWKGIQLGESGYFFIVNDRGKIIYHPNEARIGKQLDGEQYETIVSQHELKDIFALPDEEGRLFFSRKSEYSGWTLVSSISASEHKAPIASLRQTSLLVGACTLIIALLIAYRFGLSLNRPIHRLEEAMRETEKGNWTKVPISGSRDEIDKLITNYNTMVSRLEDLVDHVYEAELRNQENLLKRQTAEYHALQLQINPHFLYNTLESIICYAIIQKSDEIKEMVRSLSYMLRYAIRTDQKEITIANELMHVLHFMNILKYRTQRDFEIDVKVPPELLLTKTIRLTIQPLVENAFMHAFPNGIEPHHKISIDAWLEEKDLILCVADNGAGIPAEKLADIRTRLKDEDEMSGRETAEEAFASDGSIGLTNVHSRIRMAYGEPYGLTVESVVHEGTQMLLRLPARWEKAWDDKSYRELGLMEEDMKGAGRIGIAGLGNIPGKT